MDGKRADTGSATGVYLTYRSNIFGDLAKIVGNNTATIKLPLTATNKKILEAAFVPSGSSSYPYEVHNASLVRDGLPIIEGATAVLLRTTETAADIALTWGATSGLTDFLNSGDKLPDMADQFDEVVVWQSAVDNPDGSAVFPRAKYGFSNTESGAGFHPFLSVGTLLGYIQTYYGITFAYDATPWEDDNWVVPILKRDGLDVSTSVSSVNTFRVWSGQVCTVPQLVMDYGNGKTFDPDLLKYTQDPNATSWGVLATLRKAITVKITGTVQVLLLCNASTWESQARSARFQIYTQAATSYLTFEDDGNPQTSLAPSSVELAENSTTQVMVTFEVDEEVDIPDASTGLFFTLGGYNTYSQDYATSQTLRISAHQNEVQPNEEWPLVKNLPDVSVLNFVKNIAQMAGLFAFVDSDGAVHFTSFDTLEDNKANAVDWSDYLIGNKFAIPQALEFVVGEEAQHNAMKYKGDVDAMNGEYTVSNETLEYERDAVTLEFKGYTLRGGLAYIPLYSYNDDAELEYDEDGDPYVCALVADDTAADYYLTNDGVTWPQLLAANYVQYIEALNEAKVVTETFLLKPLVLRSLDMRVPVYLRQYGAYFAISEIKTKANNLAEVKLIKI